MKSDQCTIKTFQQFRDAAYAFRLPRILFSALDLDIFNVMGKKVWTLPSLAKRLKASSRGTEILCRNLASGGLLTKSSKGYACSPFTKKYLQEASSDYREAYINLMHRQWGEWSLLTEAIRTGKPVDADEPDTDEYRRSFSWAMHHRSLEPAAQVAKQIPLRGAESFLDLGGGPGTYALAFLKQNPKLQATVMDRSPALEVAQILAKQSRVGSRLNVHPCNFLQEKIPGKFDVIWYSNVLHIYSPEENQKIFKKIKQALNPNGRLLIQDTFLQDGKGLYPAETNLFAVTMLLFTETGNTYSLKDVKAWLTRTGFPRSRVISLKKDTGDWEGKILEGRKG